MQELLNDGGAAENVRLEFKSEVPDKRETLKKLSSFANTFGGFLVIGAKANGSDGRLVELPGVVLENSYRQKIVSWCSEGASPPFTVEVSEPIGHPTEPNKVFYVIYVPESDLGPHFLNDRQGVYVRVDEFSKRILPQLATESEVGQLLQRRRATVNRRDDLVRRSKERFRQWMRRAVGEAHRTTRQPSASWLELSVGPRFPSREVCEHSILVAKFGECRVPWRGTTFPHSSASLISQHESALYLMPMHDRVSAGIIEANVWGMLFYGIELDLELRSEGQSVQGLAPNAIAGHLLVFFEHARSLLQLLGARGPLTVNTSLTGVRGVRWYNNVCGALLPANCSELDDEFSFAVSTTREEVDEPQALVEKILKPILFGTNMHEWAASQDKLLSL